MSPQVTRNSAARMVFSELIKRYPDIDREWLRQGLNQITVEELKLLRRDVLAETRRNLHYHGGAVDLENAVIGVTGFLANIDKRISGEPR